MHVSMPKSSKGRKRNKLAQGQNTDSSDLRPVAPLHDRCIRTQGVVIKQSSMRTTRDIPELIEAVSAQVLTLNKYSVLPSIEKKPKQEPILRGMEEKTSKLSLSDSLLLKLQQRPEKEQQKLLLSPTQTCAASQSAPEMSLVSQVLCVPGSPVACVESAENPAVEVPLDNIGSLTLAIRTPCGSRIEHRFDCDNTLQSVIAAVGAHQGRQYRHCQVETMDMPRRTFTDLQMTLGQCGIVNRSVLCISHMDLGDD